MLLYLFSILPTTAHTNTSVIPDNVIPFNVNLAMRRFLDTGSLLFVLVYTTPVLILLAIPLSLMVVLAVVRPTLPPLLFPPSPLLFYFPLFLIVTV